MKRTSNFFSIEKEKVIRAEMSFEGKKCQVGFFNLFIGHL